MVYLRLLVLPSIFGHTRIQMSVKEREEGAERGGTPKPFLKLAVRGS